MALENSARALDSAHTSAEQVARQTYGRLLAFLAYQWRDVAAAEDALSEAFAKALAVWPAQGIPSNPSAWLLQVAKRELLQAARRQRLHDSPEVQALLPSEDEATPEQSLPDERLKLLFVCAHPAIDASIHTALMLQTVLGLEVQHLAACMLASPSALAQRLVRAKRKIRDTGLRFEAPQADEIPERVHAVLEAIYAAYGLAWEDAEGVSPVLGLKQEALYLGELVCALLPESAEAKGLLAMMWLCEARQASRIDASTGAIVPLHLQNTAVWQHDLIDRAEQLLRDAAALQTPGVFQIEAAIQSAHTQRRHTGQVPWRAVVALYERLLTDAPTLGAKVAQVAALSRVENGARLDQAQSLLNAIALEYPSAVPSYAPYWAAQAQLHALCSHPKPAIEAWRKALALTHAQSAKQFMNAEIARLESAL